MDSARRVLYGSTAGFVIVFALWVALVASRHA